MAESGFGVFSLASPHAPSLWETDVDEMGKMVRQRRYHSRSRGGCMNCKTRKVKCDENRPICQRCSARGDDCMYALLDNLREHKAARSGSKRNASTKLSSGPSEPLPDLVYRNRNLQKLRSEICQISPSAREQMSLRLMYHFEHFTAHTLIFGNAFWRDRILPLALHHDYLMHAVLTISASHLSSLLPEQTEYKTAMNIHFSHTIPGFRRAVGSVSFHSQDTDALIACGFLLLYYAWYIPFFNVAEDNSDAGTLASDGLLWFANGLKAVITAAYQRQCQEFCCDGIFHNLAIPQYLRLLKQIRTRTKDLCFHNSYNFEKLFLGRQNEENLELKDILSLREEYREVKMEDLLSPVFHTLDSHSRGLDLSDIMPSFMVYSLTIPTKIPKSFTSKINEEDPHALLAMLSFYASVWRIISNEEWWARRRCQVMCETILNQLTSQEIGVWGGNIDHIVEYFSFKRKGS